MAASASLPGSASSARRILTRPRKRSSAAPVQPLLPASGCRSPLRRSFAPARAVPAPARRGSRPRSEPQRRAARRRRRFRAAPWRATTTRRIPPETAVPCRPRCGSAAAPASVPYRSDRRPATVRPFRRPAGGCPSSAMADCCVCNDCCSGSSLAASSAIRACCACSVRSRRAVRSETPPACACTEFASRSSRVVMIGNAGRDRGDPLPHLVQFGGTRRGFLFEGADALFQFRHCGSRRRDLLLQGLGSAAAPRRAVRRLPDRRRSASPPQGSRGAQSGAVPTSARTSSKATARPSASPR